MHNLALHCKDKENNPVAKENGPEDRDIKYREESHHKSYNKSFCDCIPETQGNSKHEHHAFELKADIENSD